MRNLQKISFLAVCGLWISTAADAMNSNSVLGNQKLRSSFVRRYVVSDQENIDPNISRPVKRQKIEDYDGFNECDSNPLLNFTMTEAEKILGNPNIIIQRLARKKETFTRADIRRAVKEGISTDESPHSKSELEEITNKVVEAARCIGNDKNGDDLYWKKIQNGGDYRKNFLRPIIYSSVSKEWKPAVLEWDKIKEYKVDEEECICGKEKIKYVAKIRNRYNGNELYPIGSCCIGKFAPKEMTENFDACNRMTNKISKKVSKLRETIDQGESIKFTARLFSGELIRYLNKKGAFNDSDSQFLLDIRSKRRKNSGEQKRINKIIDESVVPYVKKRPRNEEITIDNQMLEQLKG